jgi:hypothetical protein
MLMPTLDCKRVMFYSPADEAAFFRFAESIKAVRKIEGVGDSIVLHLASRVSHTSLRDLLALFERIAFLRCRSLRSFFRHRTKVGSQTRRNSGIRRSLPMQRAASNRTLELTASRRTTFFSMTSTLSPVAMRALARSTSAHSR